MPYFRAFWFLSLSCFAQYSIQRTVSPIHIDGKLDEPAWRDARSMGDFTFNWYQSGEKEQTVAKMLWDDENLYVSWYVRDKHISAYEKRRHGPVSKDDCVEIFVAPNPAKAGNYYTWEINAIGTMLNRNKADWYTGGATWEPDGVEYRATFHGAAKKDDAPEDDHWIVEMKVPFRNFARDAAHTPPLAGDEWSLNVNRIGGKTNAQLSSWSPIRPPLKGFHSPEAFGRVVFADPPVAAGARRGGQRIRFNAADARAGHAIYNRSCTMCHGLDGAPGDRAPALGAQRRYLRATSEELFDAIKNGIRGTAMPASPLPETDVRKIVAYVHSLRATAVDLDVPGNPANGQEVFLSKAKCAQCHMLNGRGGILGPDLSNIGAERSLAAIRDALTVPKPVPPRGFQPVKVTTAAGRSFEGIVKNQHNTSFQILGLDNKLHLLTAAQIKDIQFQPKSLMPASFDKSLTPVELQDLLAYLSRQARSRR
ncbi:MAG: c-type cytochrome [Bryobacterales bacterium]|nr:c-type cytochrome [Bryobacterales bacterium]